MEESRAVGERGDSTREMRAMKASQPGDKDHPDCRHTQEGTERGAGGCPSRQGDKHRRRGEWERGRGEIERGCRRGAGGTWHNTTPLPGGSWICIREHPDKIQYNKKLGGPVPLAAI